MAYTCPRCKTNMKRKERGGYYYYECPQCGAQVITDS